MFVPLGERVVISPDKPKDVDTTGSGLLVVKNFPLPPNSGTVLSVGPDVKRVKVNDVVVFPRGGQLEIEVEGQKMIVFMEKDIVGIIE